MAKLRIGQKAHRVLDFLVGVGHRDARRALEGFGFKDDDLEDGWRRLRALSYVSALAPSEPAADLSSELAAWGSPSATAARCAPIASAAARVETTPVKSAHDWRSRRSSTTAVGWVAPGVLDLLARRRIGSNRGEREGEMVNTSRTVVVMIAVAAIASSGCGGEPAGCPMGTRQLADGGCALPDAGPTQDSGPSTAPCTRASDCDDGMFCNGVERCEPGSSGADARGCVAAAAPCMASQMCDEDLDLCVTDCSDPDADVDGDRALGCGGGDCDETDPAVNSLVNEVCDDHGVNEDCNWMTIHNAETNDGDRDGDRHIDVRCFNVREDGTENRGTDCDDTAPTVNAAGVEACNGVDDNCDGRVDEGLLSRYYRDDDGDLYGRDDDMVDACARPADYVVVGGDCDDDDRMINPAGRETCDGVDQDCDGRVDEEAEELGTREHCSACGDECQFACGGTGCDLAVDVETSWGHVCTRLASGLVYCWGGGTSGQLGNGSSSTMSRAVRVAGVSNVRSLGVGRTHTCVVEDETVMCFGANALLQLGRGAGPSSETPLVADPGSYSIVSAAANHTCAVSTSGVDRVFCWGANDLGQLGLGHTLSPRLVTLVPGSGAPTGLSAGGEHVCASYGTGIRCWGSNYQGQIGIGTNGEPITVPTAVTSWSGPVLQVGAGHRVQCASQVGGDLYCWGLAFHGQLARSAGDPRLPGPVSGLSMVASFSAGVTHSCAATAGGAVYCWGDNTRGQIGNGGADGDEDLPPTLVAGITATDVSCGFEVSCAVSTSGLVYCWGWNDAGRTGVGTPLGSTLVPTRVVAE